ncbi:hypothetical protein D3C77_467400 [compost metagenome]
MNGIRRRNKHDVRQIKRKLDEVIAERIVLLGIQHFKQRGRWIAPKVRGHLVDFVEQKYRIKRAGRFHPLDDAAWHRTYISTAMSADFRFVSYTA